MPISPIHPFNPESDLKRWEGSVPEQKIAERMATADLQNQHLAEKYDPHLEKMNDDERDALADYTSTSHKEMNHSLWTGSTHPTDHTNKSIKNLHGALDRISKASPIDTPLFTYTGIQSSPQNVDGQQGNEPFYHKIMSLSPGQHVSLAGFTSSSTDLITSSAFAHESLRPDIMPHPPKEIHKHYAVFEHPVGTTAGVYIDSYSEHSGEFEHLIKPGARFVYGGIAHKVVIPTHVKAYGSFSGYHPLNSLWQGGRMLDAEPIMLNAVHHLHHFKALE